MKAVMFLAVLFGSLYFGLRVIGKSGRAAIWRAISPHLFPIVMILTIIFGLLTLHFNGVTLRLFS